jgi:hypothetical protein
MLKKRTYLYWAMLLVAAMMITSTLVSSPAHAKSSKKTVKGPAGQTLTVSATSVKNGQTVTVTGKKYDRKTGIYLAFCVIGAKGVAPGPCGGGVNTSGSATSSIWISSNPPAYGKSLAIPFSKSGGFKQRIKVSRYIGKIDCFVAKCAVVTRADHTKSANRKADVIVPVKFRK